MTIMKSGVHLVWGIVWQLSSNQIDKLRCIPFKKKPHKYTVGIILVSLVNLDLLTTILLFSHWEIH